MAKTTNTVLVAAAKTASDMNANAGDRQAASDIVRAAVDYQPGDEVFIMTATLYWAGTLIEWGERWVTLADATSITETGSIASMKEWGWASAELIPAGGIVRVETQGIMAHNRKGGK